MADTAILLFDSVCNLCNAAVDFIIKRDKRAYFRFASLQSEVGVRLLKEHRIGASHHQTVVLLESGEAHTRSDAALRVARRLTGPTKLLYALVAVPRPARDWAYDLLARRRYRWFGKRDTCRTPTPEERDRFLDEGAPVGAEASQ